MRSKKRVLLTLVIAIAITAGCRAFVDLEGLQGGAEPQPPQEDAGEDRAIDAGTDVADALVQIDAPADSDASAATCPGKGGPTPVLVSAGSKRFCIDSSEVTNEHYDAFLKSNPTQQANPAFCAWNASFTPTTFPYEAAKKDFAVGGVNYCHAYEFCKWAGKRLCGKIGGGVMTPGEMVDPTLSEYVFACTKGGSQTLPYGNAYDPAACNGGDSPLDGPHAVKTLGMCQTNGVYDLAGNLHEWIDSCVPGTEGFPSDPCGHQLSAWDHGAGDMPCARVQGLRRDFVEPQLGFRCCSDAP